jgi:SAM-dependent methyltransferase
MAVAVIDQVETSPIPASGPRVPPYACPIDRALLTPSKSALACPECDMQFPIVRGVPVLINDANSVFCIADYTGDSGYQGASGYAGSLDSSGPLRRAYRRFAMALAEAPLAKVNLDPIALIRERMPNARILIIGSGERDRSDRVVVTDVAFARNVDCICDGHDLPFADGSFDAVLAEAVLEHVCDPQRVAGEIARVLSSGGLVYALTPFLQPVHMGAYDFSRFTYLGHRRLFRQFDELKSGVAGGGMASAVLLTRSMLTSLTDRAMMRSILRLIGLIITWPLRFLDVAFVQTDSGYNAACATYFFGQKRETPISDREIIGLFRGR